MDSVAAPGQICCGYSDTGTFIVNILAVGQIYVGQNNNANYLFWALGHWDILLGRVAMEQVYVMYSGVGKFFGYNVAVG